MNLFSRILSFSLIFQLLALSSIPPVLAGDNLDVRKGTFEKQYEISDHPGLLGQLGGFVKNEQYIISEDDSEDSEQLQCLPNIGKERVLKPIVIPDELNLPFHNLHIPSKGALFVLFHCWKLDTCID